MDHYYLAIEALQKRKTPNHLISLVLSHVDYPKILREEFIKLVLRENSNVRYRELMRRMLIEKIGCNWKEFYERTKQEVKQNVVTRLHNILNSTDHEEIQRKIDMRENFPLYEVRYIKHEGGLLFNINKALYHLKIMLENYYILTLPISSRDKVEVNLENFYPLAEIYGPRGEAVPTFDISEIRY